MDFNSKFWYAQYMNDKTFLLDLLDKLDRISAILTVTAEMDGLDKAVAKTLGHVTIDLLPEVEATVKKLIKDPENPNIEKSTPALTA